MIDLAISDWRLIGLELEGVGPFRERQTFSFMGDTPPAGSEDAQPGPSNLYMLIARNGRGKTTILESVFGLFGLLSRPVVGRFADWRVPGAAQLDVRATWTVEGATRTVLLSIWTGAPKPLEHWTRDRLEEEADATVWAKLGLLRTPGAEVTFYDETDELGLLLARAIAESAGEASGSVFGKTLDLPTVLFFPADRMLLTPPERRVVEAPANWSYQPAHQFGVDGATWNGSIDNLFAWLNWLEDRRDLGELTAFVNRSVFPDGDKRLIEMERAELTSYVRTERGRHPLGAMSHGERTLLQLFLRTAAHMTRNTVVLIDEVEMHLHTRWMNRMFQALKSLLLDVPTLSIFFTTHSRELMRVFDHRTPEPGLTKGGYLITEGMD